MVWLDEINRKLVSKMRDNITIIDEQGFSSSVDVNYVNPEGEFTEEVTENLPKIGIKLYDLLLDKSRVGMTHSLSEIIDETEDYATVRSYPLPYWLYYEIIILAEYHQDIMNITTQLQQLFPPRGELLVPDNETEENVSLFMESRGMHLPQQAEQEKTGVENRQLRRMKSRFRYRITAELPIEDAKQYYKVKELDIQVDSKGGENDD